MMNHPTAKKFRSHLAHLALKSVVRFSCVYCDLCSILGPAAVFFYTVKAVATQHHHHSTCLLTLTHKQNEILHSTIESSGEKFIAPILG